MSWNSEVFFPKPTCFKIKLKIMLSERDSQNNEITSNTQIGTSPRTRDLNNHADRANSSNTTVTRSGTAELTRDTNKNSTKSENGARESIRGERKQANVKECPGEMVQTLRQLNVNQEISIPIVGYEVMEERARFTIYKLKVEDSRTGLSWLVFRRYTDFVRLCARMQAERPGAAPRLPAKRWLRDNFEPAFLEERARGLQVFVNSLMRRMPDHRGVREFFCLDDPPQACTYQPEVQAVYGAFEDSINALRTQLQQKESAIARLEQRVQMLERDRALCRCAKGS